MFNGITDQFDIAASVKDRAANLRSKLRAIKEGATEGPDDETDLHILLQELEEYNNTAPKSSTAVNTNRPVYGAFCEISKEEFRSTFMPCTRCYSMQKACYIISPDNRFHELKKMGYGCRLCFSADIRCSMAFNPATQVQYPRAEIEQEVALELQMAANERREEISRAVADKRHREEVDKAVASKKRRAVTGAATQTKEASTSSVADALRAHAKTSRLMRKEASKQFDALKHTMETQRLKATKFIDEWESKVGGEGGNEDFEEGEEDEEEE